jgi:hypothetical protein
MSDAAARIDVDYVPVVADVQRFAPYLERHWSEYLGLGQDFSHHGSFRFALPGSTYEDPTPAPGSARASTRTSSVTT